MSLEELQQREHFKMLAAAIMREHHTLYGGPETPAITIDALVKIFSSVSREIQVVPGVNDTIDVLHMQLQSRIEQAAYLEKEIDSLRAELDQFKSNPTGEMK